MRSEEDSSGGRHTTRQTCPSGRCREGATLLGILGADGALGYVTPRITVDAAFVAGARRGRQPEARFRFAEPCVEHECAHWSDNHCGLIYQILDSPAVARVTREATSLPECVIRESCRWFAQANAAACAVCPHVVHTPG